MSQTKWTPGPWSISYGYSDGGGALRQIETADEIIVDHVYGDENASLIAAAPDMAAALQLFLDSCDNSECMYCEKARAALAKAMGESS